MEWHSKEQFHISTQLILTIFVSFLLVVLLLLSLEPCLNLEISTDCNKHENLMSISIFEVLTSPSPTSEIMTSSAWLSSIVRLNFEAFSTGERHCHHIRTCSRPPTARFDFMSFKYQTNAKSTNLRLQLIVFHVSSHGIGNHCHDRNPHMKALSVIDGVGVTESCKKSTASWKRVSDPLQGLQFGLNSSGLVCEVFDPR